MPAFGVIRNANSEDWPPKLLDRVRGATCFRHYSREQEQAYVN